VLSLMARLDPKQAEKWSKEIKTPPKKEEEKSIEQIAEDDLEEALSMLDKDPDRSRNQLWQLVNYFTKSDKEKARQCAEEGIIRARSLDQPERALELARWGAAVMALDDQDAGKKILGEAAEMTEKWKSSERNNRAFGEMAAAVAPCDAARAVRLLKKIPNEAERLRYQAQVAAAIDDLEQVEPLLKGLDPDAADSARLNIIYRIAPKRSDDAVRLLDGVIERLKEDEKKAEYCAELAKLIERHNPARTSALIDRAFAVYLPTTRRPAGDDGRLAQAAELAVVASKIGYADMENMIHRALALRPTPSDDESPVPAMESTVRATMVLALADPETARQMLQTIEPNSSSLGDRENWLKAWALADPKHALELADRELAVTQDPKAKTAKIQTVLGAAELWITPPDERLELLKQSNNYIMEGMPEVDFDYEAVPN
jgi:hypothetical protein